MFSAFTIRSISCFRGDENVGRFKKKCLQLIPLTSRAKLEVLMMPGLNYSKDLYCLVIFQNVAEVDLVIPTGTIYGRSIL